MATQTAPADWREESDAVIATVLDVLNIQAERMQKRGRKR